MATSPLTWDQIASEPTNSGRLSRTGELRPNILGTQTDAVPAEYSDDALAQVFTEHYGDDLRYTAAWNRWAIWNGHVWESDNTRKVLDLAREICRGESESCKDEKLARHVASARTIAAVERLAQADRRHAATVEQWDADPWILNTPDGVVDLRTGKLRLARREDFCTRSTVVAPGGDCPRWRAFLAQIADGNQDLVAFIQRACGYILTGVTVEHAMFFLHGTGANGKSVFLNALSGLMGNYARLAAIETFTDTKHQSHPTDVAGLQGARLVTAVETEDGRRWAESKVKTLTGGDPVTARFMRQDFFEYVPQFKLVIAGNHKPGLRTVDEAMRRRLNMVPFTVTIPPEERDPAFGEKLRLEWPGILKWAVEGCLAWQRDGLNRPAIVTSATEEYFADEDAVARWLDECTDLNATAWVAVSDLFTSWKTWADSNGEYPGSQKRLSINLTTRGYKPFRKKDARGFEGIALRAATDDTCDATSAYPSRAHVYGNREVPSHVSPEDGAAVPMDFPFPTEVVEGTRGSVLPNGKTASMRDLLGRRVSI